MKKALLLGALVLLFALQGHAQDTPKVELFGGYSYIPISSASAGFSAYKGQSPLSASGWEASANWNLNRWFGIKGDFGGVYCCSGQYLYSFLAGPQLSLRKPKYTFFVHPMLGGAYAQGLSATNTSFALVLGGGLDWNLHRRLAIRLPQVDYFSTHFYGATQNDLRLSAGLVFRFSNK
jgi:hypothetical protein